MNRTLLVLTLLSGLVNLAWATEENTNIEVKDAEIRQLTGNGVTITVGYTAFLLGVTSLIALAVLIGLSYFYATGDGSGSGYSASGSGSSYSAYSRKSFNYDGVNWEQFTILDFIAIAEEAYQKFNPSDLECQKRLICEIHQNTAKFGFAAQRMVDMFSYLQYIEVLSLPDEFKALAEEYLDAADRGRNMSKDCGEVYDTCKFSVKKLTDKFSHNEI